MPRKTPVGIHVVSVIFASVIMLFSYAALMENGILHSIAGFIFGFIFLFYLYGQRFDRFYIHLGEKVKIGGDATGRTIEIDDKRDDKENGKLKK